MTNEQILQAVNRLTDTYNQLNDRLVLLQQTGQLPTPLYSNARIIWDGREDFQMTDEPLTNLIGVGTGAVAKYGKWQAQYMVKFTEHTVISNCETQTPINYIVIKVKLPENKDGTFFIKYANSDNWRHGITTAWMCKADKSIKTLLGSQVADKHTDYGKSVAFNPKNQDAWVSRYYQWIGFNYNKGDIIKDGDGYSYIALSSSSSDWYLGGWAVAERNTDFVWTPAHIFDLDFYGATGKATNAGLYEQLTASSFAANKTHKDVRVPYQRTGKDILIGILCWDDYNIPNPVFSGAKTQNVYRYDAVPAGNFARIRNNFTKYRWGFVHVSAQEAAANTTDISGLHCLQLDIKISENERAFYFAGMFTESEA